MWRWAAVVVVAWLGVAAPARAAAPVTLGSGPGGLLALAADHGVGYAVLGSAGADRPLALVRSSGRGAGRSAAVRFGDPGAVDVDADAGPDGVLVTWARPVSAGFELKLAPATDLAHPQAVAQGTGPPRLDAAAAPAAALAYPDAFGDAVYGLARLTDDGPDHRHLPLDAAAGLVLDVDQRHGATQLRVLGDGAPSQPIVSLGRLEDLDGTLAVDGAHVYVAFARGGRAFLATAARSATGRWRVRRVADGVSGRPAVVRAAGRTRLAYARSGQIVLDRRILARGSRPLLATDGSTVLIGWTRGRTALLARAG